MGELDYNNDGEADLFLGDLWGIGRTDRDRGGHLFFSATRLKNRNFSVSNVPGDLVVTTILGPEAGTISNDTSLHGDIDGDGRTDLIVNEMRGNGISPASLDVGNLLIIGGAHIPK